MEEYNYRYSFGESPEANCFIIHNILITKGVLLSANLLLLLLFYNEYFLL